MRRAAQLAGLFASACLTASACGDNGTEPAGTGLRFVSGNGATDTTLARLAQRLVVEVRSPSGAPATGTVVRFASLPMDSAPSILGVLVAPDTSYYSFSGFAADTVGPNALASVVIRMDTRAGGAKLLVSAPEFGFQDTARFTVLPGKPVRVAVTPGDTAVYDGVTFQASAIALDQWGNARNDPVTFAAVTDVTVSPRGTVTAGASVARASYVASVVGASGTGWVSIVPHATLLAYQASSDGGGPGLVTFNLDGSGYRLVVPGNLDTYLGVAPAWIRSGTAVVFGGPGRLGMYTGWVYTSNLSDPPQQLGTPGDSSLTWASWPVYSPDGQSLYFSGYASPYQFSLWRADADGANPHLLYADPSGIAWRQSVSPEGTRVAFASDHQAVIRVLTIATGAVSSWSVPGHTPRWSPTGETIAFTTQFGGPIYLMNSDGTGVRRVSDPTRAYSETSLAWSPDGAWLVARGTVLELIDVTSGLTLPLAYSGALVEPAWKP